MVLKFIKNKYMHYKKHAYYKLLDNVDLSHIKEVYLHIGMHKTGTTSIQKTLQENTDLLLESGYYYSVKWGENQIYNLASIIKEDPYSNVDYLAEKMDKSAVDAFRQESILQLLDEISDKRISTLIFSSEYFSFASAYEIEQMRIFLQHLFPHKPKLSLVYATRSPISWIRSMELQWLKGSGLITTPHQRSDFLKTLYSDTLLKFQHFFPDAHQIIYKFEDSLNHEFGPVGYFMAQIGYPKDQIGRLHFKNANQGVCSDVSQLLLYINSFASYYLNNNKANGINIEAGRRENDTQPLEDIKGKPFEYDEQTKLFLYSLFKDDVNWLKQHTNIDYTDFYTPEKLSEDFVKAVKLRRDQLTPTLQKLVDEYLLLQG